MSQPDPVLAFIAGVMVGAFLFRSTMFWGYSVWVALREQRIANSRAAVPVVLFLHSGPWLLGAYIFLAVHFLSRPHGAAWTSFFIGSGVGTALMFIPVVRFFRLKKLRRNEPVQP